MRTGSIIYILNTLLLSTMIISATAQDNNLLVDKEKVNQEFHDLVKSMPSAIHDAELETAFRRHARA